MPYGETTMSLYYKARSLSILPTWPEFFTFFVMFILLLVMFALFHNNSIQKDVRKQSRCARAKEIGRTAGQYVVKAFNKNNQELYQVGYDLSTREVTVDCACPQGKVSNTFKNIPIYNLNTQTTQKINEKSCACDQSYYRPNDTIYYKGYPGLVSFMNSQDTSFFKAALDQ